MSLRFFHMSNNPCIQDSWIIKCFSSSLCEGCFLSVWQQFQNESVTLIIIFLLIHCRLHFLAQKHLKNIFMIILFHFLFFMNSDCFLHLILIFCYLYYYSHYCPFFFCQELLKYINKQVSSESVQPGFNSACFFLHFYIFFLILHRFL